MKKTLPLLALMIVLGACEKQPEYVLNQDVFCGYRKELACKDTNIFCENYTEVFVCEDAEGKPVTGHIISRYSDGTKQADTFVKNGLGHGSFKSFYPNGKILEKASYKKGRLHGSVKGYYTNGKLREIDNYKNGAEVGNGYTYYENGKVAFKLKRKNGHWHKTAQYDEQGRLIKEAIYNNPSSISKDYDEKGLLKKIEYFGKHKVGREYYTNGKLNGIRIKYAEDGQTLMYEESWKDGMLNGVTKQYDSDGKLADETTYVNGIRNGIRKSYYSDGSVWVEEFYLYDVPHGTSKMFYQNGQLWEETNYNHGIRDGVSKTYSDKGKLESEEIYKDNKLIEKIK